MNIKTSRYKECGSQLPIRLSISEYPLPEHIRVLIDILEGPLYEFFGQLLIRTFMPQEMRFVIAVEGCAEIPSQVMRKT